MKLILSTTCALVLLPGAVLGDCPDMAERADNIAHARLFIEDNAADGDIGVHGLFDDQGWRVLCVFAPDGTEVLSIEAKGQLGDLGIAGIFFESNEPEYEDWGYEQLLEAFDEGRYEVRGVNNDGSVLKGVARFTTVVPVPPTILSPESTPEEEGDLPAVPFDDLLVSWLPSDRSRDGRPITIVGYEVIITNESFEGSDDNFARPIYDVHVGGDRTELVVPKGFLDPATVYEIEVIAIEESGNQAIAGASFFRTEG